MEGLFEILNTKMANVQSYICIQERVFENAVFDDQGGVFETFY